MKSPAANIALCLALLGVAPLRAEENTMPVNTNPSLPFTIQIKGVSPEPSCRGWGPWMKNAGSVFANSGTSSLKFGDITLPSNSVAVDPSHARAVAIGWRSPIDGTVSIRAKLTHPTNWWYNSVAVAILAEGKPFQERQIAAGMFGMTKSCIDLDPANTQRLASIPVAKGDCLQLQVSPMLAHGSNVTIVEWVIAEVGGEGRTWDLAKDVSPDIQAGNPHADSLGNPNVWYFSTPAAWFPPEKFVTAQAPTAAPTAEKWSVATDDTKVTVGATTTGQFCLYEVSNPADGWNWTVKPSVVDLPGKAKVKDVERDLHWKFKDGMVDKTDGMKLTVRFVNESPALELQSVWWARPGRGPVRHAIWIVNRSEEPVTFFEQPSVQLDIAGKADDGALTMVTIHTDGIFPDSIGIYRHPVEPGFYRRSVTEPIDTQFIPYALFDAGGKRGVYVGVEWSYCRIAAALPEDQKPGGVRIRGGVHPEFSLVVAPGETFEVPAGLIGAYKGDIDDAGNSLRKYLFNYSMPDIVRNDTGYPKVQWNAFGATGDKPGSWTCVEKKFYPLIDDIGPLGFEEVMIDVGWWTGDFDAHPERWPSGMAKAAEYAHQAGLRFGLYMNQTANMATPEGRASRMKLVHRLYEVYHADMWRSDVTGGPVAEANFGSVKGFYVMLDQLSREIPNFQWENCSGGGRIKDFGAMKRAVKIFITDFYSTVDNRQAFYDTAYVFPPSQLLAALGSTDGKYRPAGAAGMKFAFRSMSMGAPQWFIDAPNGGNGSAPWTDEEKAAVKSAVATYKTKIRPLVRNADLYHILPRPDGKHWDGIQYYDPTTGKGVVYLFKPAAGTDAMTIKLRGVAPDKTYRLTFEDGTNPTVEKTGRELANGIEVALKGEPVSELVFLEAK